MLIASRDTESVALLTVRLGQSGHRFDCVTTLDAALRASLRRDWDLLVCDLELPDAPPLELVHAIKSQAPELPVMVLAAEVTEALKTECAAAGVTCVLAQPIDAAELEQELHYLGKARLNLVVAVVDRDAIHRVRLAKAFERLGCQVVPLEGGRALRDALSDGQRFGLVMLDIGEADALETVEQCRSHRASTFVFAESPKPGLEDAAIRGGAALFFKKPVDCDAMLAQVRFFASL